MIQVLMVCMGNICRSPMAQIVATRCADEAGLSQHISFDSAGTHAQYLGKKPDSRATSALEKKGYVRGKTRVRSVIEKDFQRFDWILAMDKSNLLELQRMCPPEHLHKIRLFLEGSGADTEEVPDPYYSNMAGFERVLNLCETGVRSLLKTLF